MPNTIETKQRPLMHQMLALCDCLIHTDGKQARNLACELRGQIETAILQAEKPGTVRELGEVVNYALTAFRKGVPVEQIFTVNPTDNSGYAARFVAGAIQHYKPEFY